MCVTLKLLLLIDDDSKLTRDSVAAWFSWVPGGLDAIERLAP